MSSKERYFVRYKPTDFDEWWDWSGPPGWDSVEDAIRAFKSNAQRYIGAREAHVVKQTTTITEEIVQRVE